MQEREKANMEAGTSCISAGSAKPMKFGQQKQVLPPLLHYRKCALTEALQISRLSAQVLNGFDCAFAVDIHIVMLDSSS